MSTFENTTDSTCRKQKGKSQCSEERCAKVKQRRREVYRVTAVDERQINLLQRRTAYLHSTTELFEQRADVTVASSPLLETANVSVVHGSAAVDSDRNLAGRPSIFEIGSTSGTATNPYNINSCAVTNKGRKSRALRHCNINDLPNTSSTLKTVPNCKFCKAKRFQ
ncbi:uncharacterized protein LOC132040346 [Lycium ferocissimum]|uniref:uncharacterized protein LOC132040346 n=1 Tax=Lycium ferocissimum TaxID=112874 RepID=UPI0028165C3E|nr:uncharacterized protein LOC132040346 [Lycium ferocissimum]